MYWTMVQESNVRNTIVEMMNDRKYSEIFAEDETTMIVRNTDTNEKIMIYFVIDPKVSVKKVKQIKDIIQNSEDVYKCLILVYQVAITTFAKQFITTDVKNLYVQAFSVKELSFNITRHKLVPKFEILSDQEKMDIITRYRTSSKHFPVMLSSDPISRYYGLTTGNMVRITRKSPTAGLHVYYRVVI